MKKFFIIFFLTIIVIFSLVYVDYFNTKTNNTFPKLSLKSEDENAIKYNAVFYRTWYCKANKRYLISSYSEDEVCPRNYSYKNGYYKNSNGVSISKKDLQLLTNDGVYTGEMIENVKDSKEIEDMVYVAYYYLKDNYKVINENENYKIVVFPEFEEVDGDYKWVYNEEENFYCLSNDGKSYAKLENNVCGVFVSFKKNEKWCKLYKNSTLIYEDNAEALCN